jgi:hypothetical protein
MTESLDSLLVRSFEIDAAIFDLLDGAEFDGTDRGQACATLCSLSMAHANGVRLLIASDLPPTAIGVLRLQYEAVVRAIWLAYAACDEDVSRLNAPLNVDTEAAASKAPGVATMLKKLEGTAPAAAVQMLTSFRNANWGTLNSFVHGGIHPIRCYEDGYSPSLIFQILHFANALVTMAGMMLGNISGDRHVAEALSKMQFKFRDCLPDLEEQNQAVDQPVQGVLP